MAFTSVALLLAFSFIDYIFFFLVPISFMMYIPCIYAHTYPPLSTLHQKILYVMNPIILINGNIFYKLLNVFHVGGPSFGIFHLFTIYLSFLSLSQSRIRFNAFMPLIF